jgi:hypothetical protein
MTTAGREIKPRRGEGKAAVVVVVVMASEIECGD